MEQRTDTGLIRDLTEGPLARQLVLFTLPIMGANLLQALYTMVDLWVVGQFASSAAISATSIAGQIVFLIHAIGIGLGNGGQVLISQQVGAKEYDRLSRTVGTLFSVCMIASIAMAALGAVFNGVWLELMNTPGEAMSEARAYLLICCIGAPFVYGSGTLCAIFRGVGDSRRPMYILGISTIINIVLDLVFVAAFHWGAAGAAWATIIAQAIGFIYGMIYLYRNRSALGFEFQPGSFRIDPATMAVILRLGAPLVVMSATITVSMLVVTAWVNVYGVAASAVTGIGAKLMTLVNVVTQSVQTAGSSIVAQNFAAGKQDRVKRTLWISLGICLTFFFITGALTQLFPREVFGIFSPDPDVLDLAPLYLRIALWQYLSLALMSPALAHINGVGFTTLNLIIAVLDGVVARIGLSLILGRTMGLEGYWWGHVLAGYVSVVMGYAYFFMNTWTKRKRLTA